MVFTRALIVLTVAGLALVSRLQWSGATRPDRSLQEQPTDAARLDLGVRVPQHGLSRGNRLPEPTYPEVGFLEALQEEKAATGCPTDRLLAAEAVAGFDNLLFTLQSGLSIARLTGRTLLVPSLRAVHNTGVRLGDVFDVRELRRFWHCWVEVDDITRYLRKARKVGRAAAAAALQQQAGNASVLLVGASWTVARHAKSMLSWGANQAGDRVQAYAAWAIGDGAAAAAPVLRLYRHLQPQMCAGTPAWDEAFWRRVRPAPLVDREVALFRKAALGGVAVPYVAVHSGRDLGRYCHRTVSVGFRAGPLQDGVRALCNLTLADIRREVLPAKGSAGAALVVLGEAWRADEAPRRAAGVAGYWAESLVVESTLFGPQRDVVKGLGGQAVLAPAVEFFLAAQAELVVGSMASRGAVAAANVRAAWKLDAVLAWPEPGKERWPFWECGRLAQCGERYFDEQRQVQRHVTCYPDTPRA